MFSCLWFAVIKMWLPRCPLYEEQAIVTMQDEPAHFFFDSTKVQPNYVQYIPKACNKFFFIKYCPVKRNDSSGALYREGF